MHHVFTLAHTCSKRVQMRFCVIRLSIPGGLGSCLEKYLSEPLPCFQSFGDLVGQVAESRRPNTFDTPHHATPLLPSQEGSCWVTCSSGWSRGNAINSSCLSYVGKVQLMPAPLLSILYIPNWPPTALSCIFPVLIRYL
mmetsp:Transcript_80141/g.141404  ORF Transcript_80141/g.141404 Transcript_80141/m.141404 type:complete len:139 (-) Transcript_80141:688-1104(-)